MSTIEEQLAGLPVTVKTYLMRLIDGSIGLSQDEKRQVQEVLANVVTAVDKSVQSPVTEETLRLLKSLKSLVWAAEMAADGRDPHAVTRDTLGLMESMREKHGPDWAERMGTPDEGDDDA